mgnify:CR=1 FL=1
MSTNRAYDKLEENITSNDLKIEGILKEASVENHLSELDEAIYNAREDVKTNNFTPYDSDIENEFEVKKTNNILLVSERWKRVYLPYSESEVNLYLEQYPDDYQSFRDVVRKEFTLPLDYYIRHPIIARFREAYSLIRDREAKSIIDAFKYAMNIMAKHELNPVIIAACKTQSQLEDYLECLSKNKLGDFKSFEIKFEIAPLA